MQALFYWNGCEYVENKQNFDQIYKVDKTFTQFVDNSFNKYNGITEETGQKILNALEEIIRLLQMMNF